MIEARQSGRHQLPRLGLGDDTLNFRREGYTYVSSRCDALGADAFRTRLMLKPVVCARGVHAAETFYGTDTFTRAGAMPKSAQHLLQDELSVQDLDGERHTRRKRLFLPMLDDDDVAAFGRQVRQIWNDRTSRSRPGDRIRLYDTLNDVLTESALRWSGLPIDRSVVLRRRRELTAMIDGAGSVGPRNWWGRLVRQGSERWAEHTIDDIRAGRLDADPGGMASAIATHSEEGEPLRPQVAAVELLNVLRPIVAIGRFAVFAAVALWTYPQWRERIARGDKGSLHRFVQEVRRFYPFFPAVGGKAVRDFDLAGHSLPAGTWMLLDLYGTNHDGRIWPEPNAFLPERFEDTEPGAYTLVPQGGGDYAAGHRCPGEPLTVEAVATLVRLLCEVEYALPAQDLTYELSRLPTLPRSGVILERR